MHQNANIFPYVNKDLILIYRAKNRNMPDNIQLEILRRILRKSLQ
jgi:hypothetical protein